MKSNFEMPVVAAEAFYLWRALLALGCVLTLSGCISRSNGVHAGCTVCLPPEKGQGSGERQPVFDLPSMWETDSGQHLTLAELKGQPVVLAMFYSDCDLSCPITIRKLQAVEQGLSARSLSRVKIVLVTFMPSLDSVRVLARFRKERRLASNWILLHGTESSTRALASRLGITFQKDSGRLVHSNEIDVLDERGHIFFSDSDLHGSPVSIVNALNELTDEHQDRR